MNTLTVQPFLVMFLIGLAAMALPVYRICRRQVGTLRLDAFRIKPSAWRSAYHRAVRAWRVLCLQLVPLIVVLLVMVVLAQAVDAHHQSSNGRSILCGAALIHLRIQERADLKAEAMTLFEKAERSADEETRLVGIETKIAALDKDIARLAALQQDERVAAGAAAGATIQVGADRALEREATLGEVMQAMVYASPAFPAHRKAVILPKGIAPHVAAVLREDGALHAAASGASSGVPESGGVLVRNAWNTSLLERVQETAKIAPLCFDMPIGEGEDGVEAPFVDETSRATGSRWGGVQVYRAAEAAAATASQPKLGKFELRLEDIIGLFYATDRVLRDATLLEALAMKAYGSEFAFKLDDEIIRGTGVGQCLGIIGNAPTVSVAKETNQGAATIMTENVEKMFSVMLANCVPGAKWYINQTCWPQLFKMYKAVGTGGVPVFMPPNGLSAAPFGTLLGLPIDVIEQASAVGTVGDIILANFKNDYALISKPMTQASSIHVLFTSNQTTFRWVWPIIGKPVRSAAVTPYKGSNVTFGPFVTLATRA